MAVNLSFGWEKCERETKTLSEVLIQTNPIRLATKRGVLPLI